MIESLNDAWEWYKSVKKLGLYMGRLGTRYWTTDALTNMLKKDNHLRSVEVPYLEEMVRRIERDTDDLGVLLMFSVFEAIVRDRARDDITESLRLPLHPLVQDVVGEMSEDLRRGSFGKIMKGFKIVNPGLIEEVNQVRRYPNWVAHGRRSLQPPLVRPKIAFERLSRFLDQLIGTPNTPA